MMESHSFVLFIIFLSAIGLFTYFLYHKQKEANKPRFKKEPQFNLGGGSSAFDSYKEQSIQHEEVVEENFLLDDPVSQAQEESIQADPLFATKSSPEVEKPQKNLRSTMEEVIYFIITAKEDRPYIGYELLQTLLTAGLRFGAMNIFHRHEDLNGRGKILFSIASASEPGTFEINKMGAYCGKGLMMFLRLTRTKDVMQAFEIMLEAAKQIVEDLGGVILDDERQPLVQEKIEKIRKKILNFEQKQLIGDLFDQ